MTDTAGRPIDERQGAAGNASFGSRLCLGEEAAQTRRRVGPVAWAVLEVLVSASGADSEAEITVRAIAGLLGLSKDTVAAASARLIDGGFVRRVSVRFARSRYRIVADVGLRQCPGFPCPDCSVTNISDKRDPCAPPDPRHTLAHHELPERFEPLRLFD